MSRSGPLPDIRRRARTQPFSGCPGALVRGWRARRIPSWLFLSKLPSMMGLSLISGERNVSPASANQALGAYSANLGLFTCSSIQRRLADVGQLWTFGLALSCVRLAND